MRAALDLYEPLRIALYYASVSFKDMQSIANIIIILEIKI